MNGADSDAKRIFGEALALRDAGQRAACLEGACSRNRRRQSCRYSVR